MVMTKAAKKKAGIKTDPATKKPTKDQIIRKLQAEIAELKNPEAETFSNEPLVRIETYTSCILKR